MIILSLSGGLGNQMFQYAFGKKIAIINHCKLKLDINYYSTQHLREFELMNYKINAEIAEKDEITQIRREQSMLQICRRKLNTFLFPRYKNNIIQEKHFHFEKELLKIDHPVYIEGYWQSPLYFKGIENQILKEFVYRKPHSEYAKVIESDIRNRKDTCSIHFRRGDFVNNPTTNKVHGVCQLDYYLRAIKKLNTLKVISMFYIFSDEPQWVRENIDLNVPCILVDKTQNLHEDLYLMQQCCHNIIANSSFSWWAAWLNLNPDKVIVAPKKWFEEKNALTADLFPANWILV